uniref:Transcriptional regulator of RNA polII SAGA subunit n=1 Tax=Zea mays TaxID=4577 RepID=A0A804NRJ2_MAIZE
MPSSIPPPPQNFLPLPSPGVGQSTRINLGEIKLKLVKRIGLERAKRYFEHLQRFLSLKLSKSLFDKFCLTILGDDNIQLHNHLVCSILHNACQASGPSTVSTPKSIGVAKNSNHVLSPTVPFSDIGDVLHHHVKDHYPRSRNAHVVQENGVVRLSKLKRFPQPHSELVELLSKRSRVENAYSNLSDPINSNCPGVSGREYVEAVAQHARGPIIAPLGVAFCSGHFGGNSKTLTLPSGASSDDSICCYDLGQLCDTSSLRQRMGRIAETEGLDAVSLECANSLNNGVDFYLKYLIGSCIELVRARSQHDRINHMALKQQLSQKLINGVQLQNQVHGQSATTCPQISSVSLQDFKALSETIPQLLGVNASLLKCFFLFHLYCLAKSKPASIHLLQLRQWKMLMNIVQYPVLVKSTAHYQDCSIKISSDLITSREC